MRILITGAGGFIGAHMVNACLDNGHQVVANFRADSIAHSAPTERVRVELLRRDGLAPRAWRISFIFHLLP